MLPFIHLGHLNIPTFGLMLWLAAVAGALILDRGFRRAAIDADAVGMVAIAVVAGIIGSKLWHVIDTPIEFREMGWKVLWDSAGFAWYGGLIFGIAALLFQGWWAKLAHCARSTWQLRLRLLAMGSAASAVSSPATAATESPQHGPGPSA